jgi:hypothetical protein
MILCAQSGKNGLMLTQPEAEKLIAMPKTFLGTEPPRIIPPGADESHELVGSEDREMFLLDLWRGSLRLSKVRHQTRGRKVIVLVRLCIDGAPHTNPDGSRLQGNHLHLYREGYGDKWAFTIDPQRFPSPADIPATLACFLKYCNIQSATSKTE